MQTEKRKIAQTEHLEGSVYFIVVVDDGVKPSTRPSLIPSIYTYIRLISQRVDCES
jgi:hypothetical protein